MPFTTAVKFDATKPVGFGSTPTVKFHLRVAGTFQERSLSPGGLRRSVGEGCVSRARQRQNHDELTDVETVNVCFDEVAICACAGTAANSAASASNPTPRSFLTEFILFFDSV